MACLTELVDVARKFIHRVDRSRIPSTSAWTRDIANKIADSSVEERSDGPPAGRQTNGAPQRS